LVQHRVQESCFAVIDVSDNSYVANVITTILSLRHTSLLVSNPVLSSNRLRAQPRRNSAVTSIIP
jgi:hypothetical protein